MPDDDEKKDALRERLKKHAEKLNADAEIVEANVLANAEAKKAALGFLTLVVSLGGEVASTFVPGSSIPVKLAERIALALIEREAAKL
jgi:hypothetical protein